MRSVDDSLRQRYRPMAAGPRAALIALVVLVVGGLVGWLIWATLANAAPPVDSKLIGFDVVDEHTTTAVVQVEVADDAEDVECRVRAIAEDKSIVGEKAWRPAPGRAGQDEVEIATERRATAVEAIGCTAAGHPRPR